MQYIDCDKYKWFSINQIECDNDAEGWNIHGWYDVISIWKECSSI